MTKLITILLLILTLSCSNSETYSTKQVCIKQDNNILVACDKSYCEVSSQQFSLTQVGGLASCRWEKK